MIIVMPFEAQLDRASFRCGKPSLDDWLHRYAHQQEKDNSARTTYLVDEREARIAGYFTLVTYRLEVEDLTPEVKRRPRYPMPAMLLARLAVDEHYQGKGLGRILLYEALKRLARGSEDIGFEVVVVDALDEDAACFYLRFGFRRFADHDLRLFMMTKDLRATFAAEISPG